MRDEAENLENPSASRIFKWWLSSTDDVIGESLRFDHCCAKDLADDVMDLSSPFGLFPPTEAVVGIDGKVFNLGQAFRDIEQKYIDGNGAGCVIEELIDSSSAMTMVRPKNHVYDIIVLRENERPTIISLVGKECDISAAKRYCTELACFLKRICLLTYKELCYTNTHLSFQRYLHYADNGFIALEDEVTYPKEYMRPTNSTLNIVRYVLAGVLLHCGVFKDRFGDTMVRHLSSCQARVLWNKWSKINVVEGRAGSGKSVLLLETIRRIVLKRHGSKIAFLCRGRGLAAFVTYQTQTMGVSVDVQTIDKETLEQLDENYFRQYTDVFVDDAHSLPMEGDKSCQSMYHSIFASLRQKQCRAYIFLDPDLQDYRGCISSDFTKQIRAMAL